MFRRLATTLGLALGAVAAEPPKSELPALAWPYPAPPPAGPSAVDPLSGPLPNLLPAPPAAPPRVSDLPSAVRALFTAPNHRWVSVTRTTPGPFPELRTEGATERGGWSMATRTGDGPDLHLVRHANSIVLQDRDGHWLSPAETRQRLTALGRSARGGLLGLGAVSPAVLAASLAGKLRNLRVEDNAILGSVDGPDAATLLMPAGPRGAATPGLRFTSAEVRFWINDGTLAKFELVARAQVTGPDGTARELETTAFTEFKDVGSSRVEVPDAARRALSP